MLVIHSSKILFQGEIVITVLLGSDAIGDGLCAGDHAAGFFGDGDKHIVDLFQVYSPAFVNHCELCCFVLA